MTCGGEAPEFLCFGHQTLTCLPQQLEQPLALVRCVSNVPGVGISRWQDQSYLQLLPNQEVMFRARALCTAHHGLCEDSTLPQMAETWPWSRLDDPQRYQIPWCYHLPCSPVDGEGFTGVLLPAKAHSQLRKSADVWLELRSVFSPCDF